MFSSIVTFFKWIGYIAIAIVLVVLGTLTAAFASIAGSIGLALGAIYLIAFVISEWNEEEEDTPPPTKKTKPP